MHSHDLYSLEVAPLIRLSVILYIGDEWHFAPLINMKVEDKGRSCTLEGHVEA
jgi:hypothetical protein